MAGLPVTDGRSALAASDRRRIPPEIGGVPSKAAQNHVHSLAILPFLTPTWRPWLERGRRCPRRCAERRSG